MALSQASQENAIAKTKALVLPGFVNGKGNLDSYLFRAEKYVTVSGGLKTI